MGIGSEEMTAKVLIGEVSGGALRITVARCVYFPLATLPSLFDTLRCPQLSLPPFQLVQSIKISIL